MILLYFLFTVFCSFLAFRLACHEIIKLDKINSKGVDSHQKYLCLALDEIAKLKTDVNQIKKDIYQ